MKFYDLHVHSAHSDGDYIPQELVRKAQEAGLAGLILADHDTILGLDQFKSAADIGGLFLGEGVEFSALVALQDIHILGYSQYFTREKIADLLAQEQHAGFKRMEAIADKLKNAGIINLDVVKIQAEKGRAAVLCKYDLQKAMMAKGIGIAQSAALLIKRESPFYASHSPEYFPSSDEVIEYIHQANGLAVLAHPFKVLKHLNLPTTEVQHQYLESFITDLVEQGLDGLEVYYSSYDAAQMSFLKNIAQKYSLSLTGGSDFHGPTHAPGRPFGLGGVDEGAWQEIKQRLNQS